MDNLQAQINNINDKLNNNTVPIHNHDDVSCNKLDANEALTSCPQPAITAPTGGGTVDSEARTAINDIITKLKNIGLTF